MESTVTIQQPIVQEQVATYEDFKKQWLAEVIDGSPSTVELGHRFSKKLVGNWLDFNAETEDITFCDGAGDGGIDIAFLVIGDETEDGTPIGNTWYLVQSKHGSAFAGPATILVEGQKVIESLRGNRSNLSSIGTDTINRLRNFINDAGPNDQLRLVYATHNPLDDNEKRAIADVRTLGRSAFENMFDVDSISIQTIYNRLAELQSTVNKTEVLLDANLVDTGNNLWVGSVNLIALYDFLKRFKKETGDLDQLYEKNVRKYLGGGRVVNKGIANTIRKEPELFGLYNNGITIVAETVKVVGNGYRITEPYVVNGCQTTKTIEQVLKEKLDSGSSKLSSETEAWRDRLKHSVVIVKLVQVGQDGESQLNEITRFTNSQNSVSRQDFIALENDFRALASTMEVSYQIYLEIHRGGWESQKMLLKQSLNTSKYKDHVNAFDMLKIFGAAWLAEPGTAFGKNPPFAPGGSIFKRIVESKNFGAKELYACYLLQKVANAIKFGRGADKPSRGQTRYLFYYILCDLIKEVLINSNLPHSPNDITEAVIKVFNIETNATNGLISIALNVVDTYLADGNPDSLFTEPEYQRTRDLNNYLKWDKLGKGREYTPKLEQLLFANKFLMGQSLSGQISIRKQVLDCII